MIDPDRYFLDPRLSSVAAEERTRPAEPSRPDWSDRATVLEGGCILIRLDPRRNRKATKPRRQGYQAP
jgi:hypothetical protein